MNPKQAHRALIKQVLAESFPGVRFAVTSLLGDGIVVGWLDGPASARVFELIYPFQTWDGREFLINGKRHAFGPRGLHIERRYSSQFVKYFSAPGAIAFELDAPNYTHQKVPTPLLDSITPVGAGINHLRAVRRG